MYLFTCKFYGDNIGEEWEKKREDKTIGEACKEKKNSFWKTLGKGMASTIATVDIKSIHGNYLILKENYPDYGETIVYFLATCFHLDHNIELDIAL